MYFNFKSQLHSYFSDQTCYKTIIMFLNSTEINGNLGNLIIGCYNLVDTKVQIFEFNSSVN